MFISQIVYVSVRFRRRYAECFISHAVIVASFFAAVETSKIIHALRLHKSCDDFIFKRNGELESCRAVLLLYSTWQSKSHVFQHCLRTLRLCLSTFCVSFNTCCAHSYCIPALCAYISTIIEHFLHAFLCVSFNACIPFIIFKRNGELESWRGGELESWRGGEL